MVFYLHAEGEIGLACDLEADAAESDYAKIMAAGIVREGCSVRVAVLEGGYRGMRRCCAPEEMLEAVISGWENVYQLRLRKVANIMKIAKSATASEEAAALEEG